MISIDREIMMMNNEVKKTTISANEMDFTCRTCGLDNKGELVILLHGFPQSSIIWENIIKKLADNGYRCLAPNQRGYSDGARPVGMENFTTRKLASDVVALADAVGEKGKFHLIGHDWGAGVGWAAVTLYPERIQSWTAMSTPHSAAFEWAVANDPEQQKQSHYIFEYLTPDLPEELLIKDDHAKLREIWNGFESKNIDDYLEIFSNKEACTSILNWYRALMLVKPSEQNPEIHFGPIYTPTCYIWGNHDFALGRVGVEKGHEYMKGYYKFVELDGAGHWLMENNEQECIKEIIELIENNPATK